MVVAAGDTVRVPPATGVTEPMPWLMLTDVALVVDQLSVLDCPVRMVCGEAESVTVGVCALATPARSIVTTTVNTLLQRESVKLIRARHS